jgi:hypothetical protein
MRLREVGLWSEAVICLGSAALTSTFFLLMTIHWVVTTLMFGPWVPTSAFVQSVYAVGTSLGVMAAVILLRTQFGRSASPASLRLVRIGLLLGTFAAALIPDGVSPALRFNEEFDVWREVLDSLLPLVCLIHFAHLARGHLFPDVFGDRGHHR